MKMKMYGHMNGNNNTNSKLVEWLSSTRIGKSRPIKRLRYSLYGLTKEEKKMVQNYEIEQRKIKEALKRYNAYQKLRPVSPIKRNSSPKTHTRVNFGVPKGYVRTPFGNVKMNPNAPRAGPGFYVPPVKPKKRRSYNYNYSKRRSHSPPPSRPPPTPPTRTESNWGRVFNALKTEERLTNRQTVNKMAKNFLNENISGNIKRRTLLLKIHPNKAKDVKEVPIRTFLTKKVTIF